MALYSIDIYPAGAVIREREGPPSILLDSRHTLLLALLLRAIANFQETPRP